jgi:hypothetical protein
MHHSDERYLVETSGAHAPSRSHSMNASRANPNGREHTPCPFESALDRGSIAPVGTSGAQDLAPTSRNEWGRPRPMQRTKHLEREFVGSIAHEMIAYVIPTSHEPISVIPKCHLLEAVLRLRLKGPSRLLSNA